MRCAIHIERLNLNQISGWGNSSDGTAGQQTIDNDLCLTGVFRCFHQRTDGWTLWRQLKQTTYCTVKKKFYTTDKWVNLKISELIDSGLDGIIDESFLIRGVLMRQNLVQFPFVLIGSRLPVVCKDYRENQITIQKYLQSESEMIWLMIVTGPDLMMWLYSQTGTIDMGESMEYQHPGEPVQMQWIWWMNLNRWFDFFSVFQFQ